METYEEELRFRYLHNLKEMYKSLTNKTHIGIEDAFFSPIMWNKGDYSITFFRGLKHKSADEWLMTVVFDKGVEKTESVFNYSAPTEYNVRRLKRLMDATM